MSYSESPGEKLDLIRNTISRTFDFTGRSRRTEVLVYWIAGALLNALVGISANLLASYEVARFANLVLSILIIVPFVALFVRRLQDQGRSGWWSSLILVGILFSVPLQVASIGGDIEQIIESQSDPLSIASGICGFLILILCFLPGNDGENRYGPNPRFD